MNGVIQAYKGIVATGIPADANGRSLVPLPDVYRTFAIEVATPSGAITSWAVNIEGSLDGVNWTSLATHNANIGTTQFAVDKPCNFMRANVTALTLGTAPSITVIIAAVP
jgi:hypothetical protein